MNEKLEKLKKTVIEKIKEVIDPEIGYNIYDLGLIYNIKITKQKIKIVMTLTTPFCPYGSYLIDELKEKLKELKLKPDIELTFDPPWSIEKMNPELKNSLNF